MLAALLVLSSASVPAVATAVVPVACGATVQTACPGRDQRDTGSAIRVGKRCHPDPTKSKSCREVLVDPAARKDAALADAR